MSKMKELSMVLDELVTCGETLISAANALKEIFNNTADAEKPPAKNSRKAPVKSKAVTATPEENPDDYPYEITDDSDSEAEAPATKSESKPEAKPITKEQVRGILAAKSGAGHSDEVRALLARFGAKQLKQVDPKDYAALIKAAEKIGTDTTGKDEVDDDE